MTDTSKTNPFSHSGKETTPPPEKLPSMMAADAPSARRTIDTAVAVRLEPQSAADTNDENIALYLSIRGSSDGLAFNPFAEFVTQTLCGGGSLTGSNAERFAKQRTSTFERCFTGLHAYDLIRSLADLWILGRASTLPGCGTSSHGNAEIRSTPERLYGRSTDATVEDANRRLAPEHVDANSLAALGRRLVQSLDGSNSNAGVLPVVQAIRAANLRGLDVHESAEKMAGDCSSLLKCKLQCPLLVELIWSYWHEQGMLVQGLNAISLRFQNRRPPTADPLARFDLTPLRMLNNILWGYIQREPDRLSVQRRAYEYDHHYGLRLTGRAVENFAPADSRHRFLEAFHNVLREASRYYRIASNSMMNPDAFPVLNAIREAHLVLAEGQANQFGDLPATARAEMLVQQWILSRPEIRDYLGGRPSMPYPEAWMPQLDTLRQVMGWNDASVRHYRDLATFGEQLLLSLRWTNWSAINTQSAAATWLAFWRPEIQSYIHSYRNVTGVDLSVEDARVVPATLVNAQPTDLILARRRAAATR